MLKKLFKTMEETKKIMEGELLAMINLKRYGNDVDAEDTHCYNGCYGYWDEFVGFKTLY